MRLDVDFSDLHEAVRRMGAGNIEVEALQLDSAQRETIDIELEEGKIIGNLSDIETDNGLLSYRGHQILLYIQDHGPRVEEALIDSNKANKYHVADCTTLEDMRAKNRFERYVITNDLNGEFHVTGVDSINRNKKIEGKSRLNVCKNCLSYLNYKGYASNTRTKFQIFQHFDLNQFFETYSSVFPYKPRRYAGASDGFYTPSWRDRSRSYRRSKNFICENCSVSLKGHESLLHVHHIDGVKSNDNRTNLRALCMDCHRKQPHHEHMHVSHNEMKQITALRRAQGLGQADNWKEAFSLSDTAVHGVLHKYRGKSYPIPEIGYEVRTPNGVVAHLELAWPKSRKGIAIDRKDQETASKAGWTVKLLGQVLSDEYGRKTTSRHDRLLNEKQLHHKRKPDYLIR